jgi:hypothetical protein
MLAYSIMEFMVFDILSKHCKLIDVLLINFSTQIVKDIRACSESVNNLTFQH